MAYQDELRSYFNELTTVFKSPLSIPDKQKVFSPLDIVNASIIITSKYYKDRYSNFALNGSSIEYTNPSSYAFCSGTGDTYRFISLPFNIDRQSVTIFPDDMGGFRLKVGGIHNESTKLLCLDENFNILKIDENGNDWIVSMTNWNKDALIGEYYVFSEYNRFTYLIFVEIRDKSQEVTNNG